MHAVSQVVGECFDFVFWNNSWVKRCISNEVNRAPISRLKSWLGGLDLATVDSIQEKAARWVGHMVGR
jgi:hypothetical protein